MTLVKTFPASVKASPVGKIPASSLTGKSSPITKKPVDVNLSLKKPAVPASPIKMKTTSMLTKSPIQAEKSPNKVEKSPPKSTGMKPSVNSTIKTVSPTLKSSVAEAKTPIRSIVKPITTLKTPEQKSLCGPKKATPLPVSKTNANSAPAALKTPTKPNLVAKNGLSPVKSASSPVKSISSPIKSSPSSVKLVSSPIKSTSSSIKSISSPIKSASSSIKSISSPIKSAPSSSAKSISSPIKSASLSIKSISSPLKPKATGEVKPSSPEKTKDVKIHPIVSSISVKKPTSILKSPLKTIPSFCNKIDSSSKLKPSIKISPISKMVKNASITTKIVSKQSTIAESSPTEVNSDLSAPAVEQVNLCQCIDTIENCQELTNTPLITEYTIDNNDSNFDVVQAIKVAQQLIQIQSNDRNLETIIETCENNSTVNWDDVITPCDEIITIANSSNRNELSHLLQNDDSISSDSSEKPISIHDSCIVEIEGLNYRPACDSEISNVKSNEQNDKFIVDENQNLIDFTDLNDPLSICEESTEIKSTEQKHFTDDLSSTNTYDSIQTQCDKNELPEWTITIDEFSINLDKKENEPPKICENIAEKENHVDDQTPNEVNSSYAGVLKKVDVISYADVLKKTPKVLTNSTNVVSCRKEPKLKVDTRIKKYQRLEKVDPIYSSDESINNIENNYQDYDYNDFYEEPVYPEMRKKKCKKIKRASKRHLKNINLEYECIENHTDVFVTSVWKNIY